MIFVRHGRALVQPDVSAPDWELDPEHTDDIAALRDRLPHRPVVSSSMRRAVETARYFAAPIIDDRLAEVTRPWTADVEQSIDRYLRGEDVDGWEAQAGARARMRAVVDEHGDAVYVTHGTVLTLYLTSVVDGLRPLDFWRSLSSPDAWALEAGRLTHLAPAPGRRPAGTIGT